MVLYLVIALLYVRRFIGLFTLQVDEINRLLVRKGAAMAGVDQVEFFQGVCNARLSGQRITLKTNQISLCSFTQETIKNGGFKDFEIFYLSITMKVVCGFYFRTIIGIKNRCVEGRKDRE